MHRVAVRNERDNQELAITGKGWQFHPQYETRVARLRQKLSCVICRVTKTRRVLVASLSRTNTDARGRVWWFSRNYSRKRSAGLLLRHFPLPVSAASRCLHTLQASQVFRNDLFDSKNRHAKSPDARRLQKSSPAPCPFPKDDGFRCTSATVDSPRSFFY